MLSVRWHIRINIPTKSTIPIQRTIVCDALCKHKNKTVSLGSLILKYNFKLVLTGGICPYLQNIKIHCCHCWFKCRKELPLFCLCVTQQHKTIKQHSLVWVFHAHLYLYQAGMAVRVTNEGKFQFKFIQQFLSSAYELWMLLLLNTGSYCLKVA